MNHACGDTRPQPEIMGYVFNVILHASDLLTAAVIVLCAT